MANSLSMQASVSYIQFVFMGGHPSQFVNAVRNLLSFLSCHVAKKSIKPAPKPIPFLSSAPQVKLQTLVLFPMTGLCQCRADRNARSSQCPSSLGATCIFRLFCGTCRAGSSYINIYLLYTHCLGIISSGESTRSNQNPSVYELSYY